MIVDNYTFFTFLIDLKFEIFLALLKTLCFVRYFQFNFQALEFVLIGIKLIMSKYFSIGV